jgi:hypothetical protein
MPSTGQRLNTVNNLYTTCYNDAKKQFESLDGGNNIFWEAKHHKHLIWKPVIKNQIVDAIQKNPKQLWNGIEVDIDFWWSDARIYCWVMSRHGYQL